jgi:lipopolysaccharide transport system ATP-binding protein
MPKLLNLITMSNKAIRVENLSKRYYIGQGKTAAYETLSERITDMLTSPFRSMRSVLQGQSSAVASDSIWALKDVSCEVNHGEVVGIIGRNGAGKSTLLKILSQITEPTEGHIDLYGRVGALLEVGTGFHPELTGRENVFLNGAILGMSRNDIQRKFDEIVDFSGVEKFIDTPVKHYSSGMKVRLAFAVAAHLEPEILVVDEVLAVGDAEFQKRCLGKMGDVTREGRTVLFVSHQMSAIEALCNRVVMLEYGQIIIQGETKRVINHYLANVLPSKVNETPLIEQSNRTGSGKIKFSGFHIEDTNGQPLMGVRSGMDVVFVFSYFCATETPLRRVDVGFSLHTANEDLMLCVLYSSYTGTLLDAIAPCGTFRCHVPRIPLNAGRYRIGARIFVNGDEADWPRNGLGYIDVETGDFYGTGSRGFTGSTPFLIDGKWTTVISTESPKYYNET